MPDLVPITNYTTLLAALDAYLARTDLQPFAPIFVQSAEGRFNTDLRTPDMQARTDPATVTINGLPLPNDFLDWVGVRWTPPDGSAQRPLFLNYKEPDSPEFRHRHRPNGVPQYYTILAKTVRIAPVLAGQVELFYYQRIPSLGPANPANWLVVKAPEIYLYGALLEAMLFQKDEARSREWFGLLDARLKAVFGQSDTQKVAARPGRAANDAADASAVASMA